MRGPSMQRSIIGFHQDERGDWVADLACGHAQHVRHKPPFIERPWVMTEAGRRGHLGTALACSLCRAPDPVSVPQKDERR